MKAIILTYASVQDYECEILKQTKIYKLALNQHAKEFMPNARIITDYVLSDICKNTSEKIISIRDRFRFYSPRVEYSNIEFKGSTMIAGVEYLISKNYDEILIVGNNTVHSQSFRNSIKNEMDKLTVRASIYQYSNGYFTLPVKTIKEFTEAQKGNICSK